MALKVIRNEVDGWDVVREEDGVALTNHRTRESAENAAHLRDEEEHHGHAGDEPIVVDSEHVHEIDETRQGMKPAFLALGALMAAVVILIIVLALTGSLTGFGS